MSHEGDGNRVWKSEHRCLFVTGGTGGKQRCNLAFANANQLKEHRQQAQHLIRRKKRQTIAQNEMPHKQLRLEDITFTPNNTEVADQKEDAAVEEDDDDDVVCTLCMLIFQLHVASLSEDFSHTWISNNILELIRYGLKRNLKSQGSTVYIDTIQECA